jgi:hypothetical protein
MSKTPNPAAVALGKLRAKTLTTEHQAAAASALAAGMTPEQRSERARNAAIARHAKQKRKRKSARR